VSNDELLFFLPATMPLFVFLVLLVIP